MHRLHVTSSGHPALASKASSQSPLAEAFLSHLHQDFLINFKVVSETSPVLSQALLTSQMHMHVCMFANVYVDLKTSVSSLIILYFSFTEAGFLADRGAH